MIYYKAENGIMINFYTESDFSFRLENKSEINIKQYTKYPEDNTINIEINPENKTIFDLYLRVPLWCNNFSIKVNGNIFRDYLKESSFIKIQKEWKPNDIVTLNLDMTLRLVKGFCKQKDKVALLYGPILFCFNPDYNKDITIEEFSTGVINPQNLSLGKIENNGFGSISCKAELLTNGKSKNVLFTPFPDPDGKATYFNLPENSNALAVNDELISLKDFKKWRKVKQGEKTDWDGK
jgi:hypothetical protein